MKRLLKFRMAENQKISISWTQTNDIIEEEDILSLTSTEEPSKSLLQKWERLETILRSVCEIPQSWFDNHNLSMKGLSISYKNDVRTFTLSGSVELDYDNKPLNITGPSKPEKDESVFGSMSADHVAIIDDFISEVWLYVNGERSQPSLFNKEEVG